jgi:hypothetical protein
MPLYFFHFVWADDAVRDTKGVELEGLGAAYRHALGLVHRVRIRFPDAGDDWLIEIGDETGRKPLVILPARIPVFGRRRPTEL